MSRFDSVVDNQTTIVSGQRDEALINLIGGKTLGFVGKTNKLGDADVKFIQGTRNDGTTVVALKLVINGVAYSIPLAEKLTEQDILGKGAKYALSCEFWVSHPYLRDDKNQIVMENGKPVRNTAERFMSFGNPRGTFFNQERAFWAEERQASAATNAPATTLVGG